MSGCTAPIDGHRTASGRANCPSCRGSSSSYSSYSSYSSTPRYPTYSGSSGGGTSSGGRSRRARNGSTVYYTAAEWRTFEPLVQKAETQAAAHPERRDLFLCHAWDDRAGAANELYKLLTSFGASVWFSEVEVALGTSLMREIDKGLRNSRLGIVLVTPALLKSLEAQGVADRELSALLATDRVIPVAHGTTFDSLRDVSPLLASRSGLTVSATLSMKDVASKVAASATVARDR